MFGCARMKHSMASLMHGSRVYVTPIFSSPYIRCFSSLILSRQAATFWMMLTARGKSSMPLSVRHTLWLVRMKSFVCSSSSSSLICCDSALWDTNNCLAALEKFLASATLMKYLSCLSSISLCLWWLGLNIKLVLQGQQTINAYSIGLSTLCKFIKLFEDMQFFLAEKID